MGTQGIRDAMPSSTALKIVPFAYGFRPFFFLAGVWAIVPMLAVAWAILTGRWPAGAPPLFTWHGHEMIFGFAGAAIAGFLLTAVPSWTGTKRVSGLPLVALVALWIVARAEYSPLWQPTQLWAQSLGVAFFPVLAALLARPIVAARNFRNLPFLLFLALLFAAEWLHHAVRLGWTAPVSFNPVHLAVDTILLVVVIVGGRIIPVFTRNALTAAGRTVQLRATRSIDALAIAAAAAMLVADVLLPASKTGGALAGLAAVLLAVRLAGWRGWRALDMPLVWVLHVGYAWLVVGLALKSALLVGGYGWAANWLHAITLGGFGTMILGVTTRAALGHTGRRLEASKPIAAAYGLVSVAAILRVGVLQLLPNAAPTVLVLTVAAWVAAFGMFLWIYTPILLLPRIDGKPG